MVQAGRWGPQSRRGLCPRDSSAKRHKPGQTSSSRRQVLSGSAAGGGGGVEGALRSHGAVAVHAAHPPGQTHVVWGFGDAARPRLLSADAGASASATTDEPQGMRKLLECIMPQSQRYMQR